MGGFDGGLGAQSTTLTLLCLSVPPPGSDCPIGTEGAPGSTNQQQGMIVNRSLVWEFGIDRGERFRGELWEFCANEWKKRSECDSLLSQKSQNATEPGQTGALLSLSPPLPPSLFLSPSPPLANRVAGVRWRETQRLSRLPEPQQGAEAEDRRADQTHANSVNTNGQRQKDPSLSLFFTPLSFSCGLCLLLFFGL